MAEDSVRPATPAPLARPTPRRLKPSERITLVRQRANRRYVAIVWLAGLVGVGVWLTVSQARSTTSALGQTIGVLVATQPIDAGLPLDDANTTTRYWPVGLVPSGAISTDEQALVSRSPINAGEVITTARVVGSSGLELDENSFLVPTLLRRDDLTVGDAVTIYGLTPIGTADNVVGAAAAPIGGGRVVAVYDQAVAVAVAQTIVAPVLESVVLGAVEIVKQPG